MVKKKTLAEQKKQALDRLKLINKKMKKEKEEPQLAFCKSLEKLLGAKLEKKHYEKLLETIKASKDNIIKSLDLKPTTTTSASSTTAKPTTNTTQAKPTTSTTPNTNNFHR